MYRRCSYLPLQNRVRRACGTGAMSTYSVSVKVSVGYSCQIMFPSRTPFSLRVPPLLSFSFSPCFPFSFILFYSCSLGKINLLFYSTFTYSLHIILAINLFILQPLSLLCTTNSINLFTCLFVVITCRSIIYYIANLIHEIEDTRKQ